MRQPRLDTELQSFILIFDPTPIEKGGYSTGARFSAIEIRNMINLRSEAIPTGAILQREGRRYQVQKKYDVKQGAYCQKLIEIHD